MGLTLGPAHGEFFVSDMFAPRIFSGRAQVEFGRIFAKDENWYDRLFLAFELAHDAGHAGGITPSVTLLHLDFAGVLWRSKIARIQAAAGFGSRVNTTSDFGFVLGMSADADLDGFLISGKIEARKQAGGFRQGFFGPQYEINRFVGAGYDGLPVADQTLPNAFSFYGELHVGSRGSLSFEAAIEHYTWGRTDLDATLQMELFEKRFVTSARFTAVAMGVKDRFAISAEARLRLFKSMYALTSGGTVFFHEVDGTLSRGVFVTLGAGFDFELFL